MKQNRWEIDDIYLGSSKKIRENDNDIYLGEFITKEGETSKVTSTEVSRTFKGIYRRSSGPFKSYSKRGQFFEGGGVKNVPAMTTTTTKTITMKTKLP